MIKMKLKIFILRRKNIFIYAGMMNGKENKGRPGGKFQCIAKTGLSANWWIMVLIQMSCAGRSEQLIFYVI